MITQSLSIVLGHQRRVKQMKKVNPRKAPLQKRSKIKVEQILNATRELLISDGLEKITTNHIARKANMSVGSLYQYFPNKQAIIFQLSERLYEHVNHEIANLELPNSLNTPIERFEYLVDHQISYWLSDPDEQKFQDEIVLAFKLYPELNEMEKNYRKVISKTLVDLMKRMQIKADEAALHFLSLFLFDLMTMVENLIFDDGYTHRKATEWGKYIAMVTVKDIIDA